MEFLIDEDLPRSTADYLRRSGHKAIDVRDVGLRGAKDYHVAAYAQSNKLCLLTGDFDFSDIRNYPPGQHSGIIVFKLPEDATASFILGLLEKFLQDKDLVSQVPGKLVIIEPGRVRVRAE